MYIYNMYVIRIFLPYNIIHHVVPFYEHLYCLQISAFKSENRTQIQRQQKQKQYQQKDNQPEKKGKNHWKN